MECDKKTMLLISYYADGEASPEEEIRAKEHLEYCIECRKLVEKWSDQQRIFEWAYAIDLLEETDTVWLEGIPAKENRMSIRDRISGVSAQVKRKSLGWAAAAVIAIFVLYHFVFLPPVLKTGEIMISRNHQQSARMEDDIQLTLGPNSKIIRIDKRTIKLEQGWIDASVRHGSGLRILAKRIEVTDQGTEFKVGTGSRLDYVIVEKGLVSVNQKNNMLKVNAGQILIAQDNITPYIASLPAEEFEDGNKGNLLNQQDHSYLPSTAQHLDWKEGLRRLAPMFPNARIDAFSGGYSSSGGVEARFGIAYIIGSKKQLNAHFDDITQAIAGGSPGTSEWDIPIAIVQVSDVDSQPRLPEDVYVLSLAAKDGKVIWTFTGSMGNKAYYPLLAEDPKDSAINHSPTYEAGALKWINTTVGFDKKISIQLWVAQWPGKIKPMLKFKQNGVPEAVAQTEKLALLAQVSRKTSQYNINLKTPDLQYLDPERKHHILVAKNDNAGIQLCNVYKQGSGSVILCAIATNSPLEEPHLKPGEYLVRFVLTDKFTSPHLELIDANKQKAKTVYVLRHIKLKSEGTTCSSSSWALLQSNCGDITGLYGFSSPDHNAFPINFQILGRPDNRKVNKNYVLNSWAEGWIRVKQP